MMKHAKLGGTFTLTGTSINLIRMGYGAMQLTGPEVWGPPRDVDGAIAVLRDAIAIRVRSHHCGAFAERTSRNPEPCSPE